MYTDVKDLLKEWDLSLHTGQSTELWEGSSTTNMFLFILIVGAIIVQMLIYKNILNTVCLWMLAFIFSTKKIPDVKFLLS